MRSPNQATELPTLLITCPICQGASPAPEVPGLGKCPCKIEGHVLYSDVAGQCNAAPVLYHLELDGLRAASASTGIPLMAVVKVRDLARRVSPEKDAQIYRMALTAARLVRRPTFSDRVAAAIGGVL